MSLRRLGVDRIDLWQLHRIDPAVPAEDQFGEIKTLQEEGLIRHVGISEVTVAETQAAQQVLEIVGRPQDLHAVDAVTALAWVVVDEADRRVVKLPIALQLAQHLAQLLREPGQPASES